MKWIRTLGLVACLSFFSAGSLGLSCGGSCPLDQNGDGQFDEADTQLMMETPDADGNGKLDAIDQIDAAIAANPLGVALACQELLASSDCVLDTNGNGLVDDSELAEHANSTDEDGNGWPDSIDQVLANDPAAGLACIDWLTEYRTQTGAGE